ncbi:phage tailspike protein [Salmonella enterica subsp. salamae]|uniref:phage tailspike protein n=1 Tax=Salmonella enterica TaxID=28901 RepID=UPI0009E9AB73|nr:phage tailspike protein [Salmonella enterica]EBQ5244171.1 phage tail protein [Salmonella enterica subsp. salamae]
MADSINANVVVSMPSQLFTMARSFKAVANGKIYIGKIDIDPTNTENQIQVYVENEDGSHIPVSQPIIINSAGYPVYNGQIAKFVTVQGHSMAVYDTYGAQQFYFPNVLKYDPDQLRQDLSSQGGVNLVNGAVSYDNLGSEYGLNLIGEYAEISNLRDVAPSVGDKVMVKEHTTGRGLLGGGVFVAVSGNYTDDDGVFISSASPSVYWVRSGAGSHVIIEWFGGKSEDQSLDHSPILANAQLYEGRSIEFQYGSYYFTPPCVIKPSMHFIGSGGAKTFWRNKNINADATVFFANTGSASSWAENTVFERIHFSNDSSSTPSNAAISLQHASLFKFDKCGFYKAPIYASDLHWVTWNGCVLIDSMTTINEASVSPTFPINEGPAFIDCYMVRSPIDITDVADLRLVGTSMFYGPYGIKSTTHRPLDSEADSRGLPVFITNSVIDNIDGYCLDLNRVAVGTITNSLFSGGRVSGTPAIRATEVLGLSFNGNVIHFAGQECMRLYDVQNLLMGNNQFSSCNGYAIKAEYCRNVAVNGNFFGNQKVTGGWNTCTGGINFNTNDNLAWLITGNAFVGVPGVVGQTGSGRTVYTATGNSGLSDN